MTTTMEVTGKIAQILPTVEGEGKNGTWKKQQVVVEYGDKYPKMACFTLWGDLILQDEELVGETVEVSFDLDSRENNGRWFTDAKAWKFKVL